MPSRPGPCAPSFRVSMWVTGQMPDATGVLDQPGGHWHDYGKSPRERRKVGHATVRADSVT